MIKALTVEFWKIRGRRVWVIVAAMLSVQILWLLRVIPRMDAHNLSQGWMNFLHLLTLLNSLMMPIIAAVVASRLCDIEHKGQTFKLLNTLTSTRYLFNTKFLCGALYMLATVLLQIIIIVIIGKTAGFTGNPPADKLFLYLLFTTAVNLTILLLQQILSLLFRNQLIPLTVGIIGSFAGLFILFFPQNFGRFLLWGYYGVLMLVGMDWDKTTRISDFYYVRADWGGFICLLIQFSVIYMIGRSLFARKEV
jgi:hypothetical protein